MSLRAFGNNSRHDAQPPDDIRTSHAPMFFQALKARVDQITGNWRIAGVHGLADSAATLSFGTAQECHLVPRAPGLSVPPVDPPGTSQSLRRAGAGAHRCMAALRTYRWVP